MDLLSARKTVRRSDGSQSQIPTESQMSLGVGNWFNHQSFPSTPINSNPSNHHPLRDNNAESSNHYMTMPMQVPITEMLNDPIWSQNMGGNVNGNIEMDMGNIGDFDINAVRTLSHRGDVC